MVECDRDPVAVGVVLACDDVVVEVCDGDGAHHKEAKYRFHEAVEHHETQLTGGCSLACISKQLRLARIFFGKHHFGS